MKEQEHTSKNKPEAKPGSEPESKDGLKALPMPELQAKLGHHRRASVKPRHRNG
jgi:hypothetical protein